MGGWGGGWCLQTTWAPSRRTWGLLYAKALPTSPRESCREPDCSAPYSTFRGASNRLHCSILFWLPLPPPPPQRPPNTCPHLPPGCRANRGREPPNASLSAQSSSRASAFGFHRLLRQLLWTTPYALPFAPSTWFTGLAQEIEFRASGPRPITRLVTGVIRGPRVRECYNWHSIGSTECHSLALLSDVAWKANNIRKACRECPCYSSSHLNNFLAAEALLRKKLLGSTVASAFFFHWGELKTRFCRRPPPHHYWQN